jgi:CheY-like chemotaxis protein
MNLAVNARDAMPEGGKLTIATRNVFLDTQYCKTHPGTAPGEYVLLEVSDDGSGMKRETLERIFEPFFSTKGRGKGTGLGLSIVYGIVKSHGGIITCYSELGEGTIFRVYLPATMGLPEVSEPLQAEDPPGGTEGILVVDDEEPLRLLAQQILTQLGYKVFTACNGREGIEMYERHLKDISLVVLDLIMPELGGQGCLKEILRINPAAKAIIASGYAANGPIEQALKEGARGFVRKPYDTREFLELVRRVLDENL